MEIVEITHNGKKTRYRSMREASIALGKKSGFLKLRRKYLGNRFAVNGMTVSILGEKEKIDPQKEKALREVFDRAKRKVESPRAVSSAKKDGKSLFAIVREIDEYNRAHGTGLSYGEYMNRGLNVEQTTAP